MNPFLQEKLVEVLAAHGLPLLDDRPRCEALLWLAAGENSRGMFALLGALERKVPHALATAPAERRDEALLAKLTQRLVEDLDTDQAAARWAVESWARAVAAAPANPPVQRPPQTPAPPAAPARGSEAKPPSGPPPEFTALPSLTLDDEPRPLPSPDEIRVRLDRLAPQPLPDEGFLRGHEGEVACVAVSPDGRTVATAGADRGVHLWDAVTGQLRGVLHGHTDRVLAVAFGPGGRTLASAGADGTVRVWDLAGRQERCTLTGHAGAVTCVAFSPRGDMLASGGVDGTVRVWQPVTGHLLKTLQGHGGAVHCVAYAPDGRTVASGSQDGTVGLWNVAMGVEWATLRGHTGGVLALAYSPGGELLVTGGEDKTVRLWNAVLARQIAVLEGELEGHTRPVQAVAFSPDGARVASGGADETVRVWDVDSRQEVWGIAAHGGAVRGVAWSSDGAWILSAGADGAVRRWKPPAPARPRGRRKQPDLLEFPGPRFKSRKQAWAWVAAVLVVGYLLFRLIDLGRERSPRWQNPPGQWGGAPVDPLDNQQVRLFAGHTEGIAGVAISADGRRALSGGFDKTVRLWDVDTGAQLWRADGHTDAVLSVAISPDGRHALSGSLDRTVRLWDARTGKELRRFDGHRSGVTCVAFSKDGTRCLSTSGFETIKHRMNQEAERGDLENMEWRRPKLFDCTVLVWDVQTGRQVGSFTSHGDEVTGAAFTPDGRHVVSGSFDKTLSLWEVETGREVRRFHGHKGEVFGVAVSPDGKHVLSCSGTLGPVPEKDKPAPKEPPREPDNTVRLWDLETGKEVRTFHGHLNAVLSVAFSADGRRAISTGFDATVRVWEVETGMALYTLHGHARAVHAAVFTPHERRALSGGWDNNLRLWRVP